MWPSCTFLQLFHCLSWRSGNFLLLLSTHSMHPAYSADNNKLFMSQGRSERTEWCHQQRTKLQSSSSAEECGTNGLCLVVGTANLIAVTFLFGASATEVGKSSVGRKPFVIYNLYTERRDHSLTRGLHTQMTIMQYHTQSSLINTCQDAGSSPLGWTPRSRCRKECRRTPAAATAARTWSRAATTWAGSPGAAGTGRRTASDLWPHPSERRRSGSTASPRPGSAPPWRCGRTCRNEKKKTGEAKTINNKTIKGVGHSNLSPVLTADCCYRHYYWQGDMTQREFPTLDSKEKSYRLFPAVNKRTRPEARFHKWAEWDILTHSTHSLWTYLRPASQLIKLQ